MKFLPWNFYDQLLNPSSMVILKTAMAISLILSTAGFLTSISTKTSFLLILFYQGLLRSFGHFNHDEMLGVYCLAVLAFTPCADAFSVDHWLRRYRDHPLSLADAVSFEVMRSRRIRQALALDEHFKLAGFDVLP